jgi:hypothetical protein
MQQRVLWALALSAAASAAFAQPAPRPAATGRPPAEPAPPPVFPCRTQAETCFLGVVIGPQVAVIFTNAQNGQGIDAKPVDVAGPDGAKIDLTPHAGRVVMLAGAYDPATGIKGELVEVASPLVSLTVKAQLGGGGPEPAPPGKPPQPKGRR